MLVLSLDEHHTTTDIAGLLGTTRGTIQSVRQSVRRKLAVPPHVDLRWFVASVPGLAELVASERSSVAATAPRNDRRSRAVLRATLRELEDLADRTTARASALATLTTNDTQLGDELRVLRNLADSLTAVSTTALERARLA